MTHGKCENVINVTCDVRVKNDPWFVCQHCAGKQKENC